MSTFHDFLEKIDNPEHKQRMEEILTWVKEEFPHLDPEIKWNQPMYTDHGTFIIGFSVSKKHIAVAPENVGMNQFLDQIEKVGYDHTKELIRIKWTDEVHYSLLQEIIAFNIMDKADCTSFWRK
ncbi:iron chaperone [Alkalihalobacillus trypoxylicola]|uniref:Iron chaperone n=1 Tax=Alkalihalobacillus trypoxylicola TaxID=519424 RepID=A0A161P6Q3_9BACI|nr:iron chaperone [Alkalihalobacillus trypoxylicola]KYG26046.1 iron chaperone [Alkalihalobacillus trypoxylicola]